MMKKAADTYITHVFTNASSSIFLYYNVVSCCYSNTAAINKLNSSFTIKYLVKITTR